MSLRNIYVLGLALVLWPAQWLFADNGATPEDTRTAPKRTNTLVGLGGTITTVVIINEINRNRRKRQGGDVQQGDDQDFSPAVDPELLGDGDEPKGGDIEPDGDGPVKDPRSPDDILGEPKKPESPPKAPRVPPPGELGDPSDLPPRQTEPENSSADQ